MRDPKRITILGYRELEEKIKQESIFYNPSALRALPLTGRKTISSGQIVFQRQK
jgi:hypothetical protein